MKTLLPLPEESYTLFLHPKTGNKYAKNAFRHLKTATEPAAHPASTSRADEEFPLDSRWRFCSVQRC